MSTFFLSRNESLWSFTFRAIVDSTSQVDTSTAGYSFDVRFDGAAPVAFVPSSITYDSRTTLMTVVVEDSANTVTPNDFDEGDIGITKAGVTLTGEIPEIAWDRETLFRGNPTTANGASTTLIVPGLTLQPGYVVFVNSGGGVNSERLIVASDTMESAISGLTPSSVVEVSRSKLGTGQIGGATAAEVRAEMDSNSTQLAAIVEDTGTTLPTTLGAIQGATFNPATDSLEAIRDRGDTAWTTADTSGLATNVGVRAEMDANSTQFAAILAALSDIGIDVDALNNVSATDVLTQVQAAIENNHLDHLLAVAYDPSMKPGSALGLLNAIIEDDNGVPRYTSNALEQAPAGTGGGGSGSFTTQDRQTLESIASNQVTQADLNGLSTFDASTTGVTVATDGITANSIATDAIDADAIADNAGNLIRDKVLNTTLTGSHEVPDSLGSYARSAGRVANNITEDGGTRIAEQEQVVIVGQVDTTAGSSTTTVFKTDSAALVALSNVDTLLGRTLYWMEGAANFPALAVIQQATKTDGDTRVELTVARPNADGRLLNALTVAPADNDLFNIAG